jgi:integrase
MNYRIRNLLQQKAKHITQNFPRMPSDAFAMRTKRNVVLYLDKELIEKSKALGFNLSKTFENHLKHLITQFSQSNSLNNSDSTSKKGKWWAEPDLNRRPLARKAPELPFEDQKEMLQRFYDFQIVDLRRAKRTAYEKVWFIRKLLKTLKKNPNEITREDLRAFLKTLEDYSAAYYKNALMAIKVFFRDYMEKPELVESFRFPHQVYKPKHIVSKEELRRFYEALETPKERALFLLYATSGLRRQEILSLKPEDIDFEKRMITPNNHFGETKKSWCSFYNEEAEQALNEYLARKKQSRSKRLFPMQRHEVVELWKSAREKTGLDITPQKLRQWFCSEMMRLGVSETYVDAFCGRIPKSVLARHYTDFSPERLEEIYNNANLDVFN